VSVSDAVVHDTTGLMERWEIRDGTPRRRVQEKHVVFGLAAAVYLALAVYLVLFRHAIFGDALSRIANAQYVISSRDPHLAAVGFVWNPLPSLVLSPFIPLRYVWPDLVSTGLLAGIESALFMAGAVTLVRGTLADLGLGRITRLVLTLGFALHPMILIYGYNGMSEAPLLFFTLLAARSLMGWLRDGTTRPLMMTGLALSLGYLTRYEAMASGAAVIALVAVVSVARTRGSWAQRRSTALTDVGIVGLPFVFTFAMWALISRLIVRQWFPTLSSEYGNTAQVAASRASIEGVIGHTPHERLAYAAHQSFGLEPLLLVVVVLAVLVAALRRDLRLLAPLGVVGAVLAFDVAVAVTGRSFGWLRFEIVEIPLAVILAGYLVAGAGRHLWLRGIAALTAAALVLPALWFSLDPVFDRQLGREESALLTAVFRPDSADRSQRVEHQRFELGRVIARDLDAMHLGRGAILTDAAYAFPILVATRHTKTFVITPDQDFQRTVADPVAFHARYLLVPDPGGANADALDVAYPSLYENGWPGGELARSWTAVTGPSWRLYQLPLTTT
jgi:hypothetical protein